ncbi:MAG: LPS-assembly protein LptD [bacterium]|nr:MAG: LPS-assembly protein LptD [bacterium]
MIRRCLAAALFLTVLLPGAAAGETVQGRIIVTSETMRSLADGTLLAEGEVQVKGEGVTVRADAMRFHPGSNTLLLTGNVTMQEEEGGAFTGDSLALDLSDLTGGISRGEIIVVPNGFRVRGEDIQRVGPEEYLVRQGVLTSCPGECPDWSFTASSIHVRREGYLSARNAAFRIAGVPVFYTPYLFFPVKTKRQTGLLLPEIGYSEELGLESTWPFFLVLGPHADVTLSPRTFSRDTLGIGFEARYRLDWGGGGDWAGYGMASRDDDRWFVHGEHSMSLFPGFWLRARWYDAGNSEAPDLFGQTFAQRHPGAVYRHATLEGDLGLLALSAGGASLLTEGALSREGTAADRIERSRTEMALGPLFLGPLTAGIEARHDRFEEGTERDLLTPVVRVRLPGSEFMSGSFLAQGILAAGGEGTVREEAYIYRFSEKMSLEAAGDWGSHRVDMDFTAATAQKAAFALTGVRDGSDAVEERRVAQAQVKSRLVVPGWTWDLTTGVWKDWELELSRSFARTRLSSRPWFLTASLNEDDAFLLVLPSMGAAQAARENWRVEAGYEARDLSVVVGKETARGSYDLAYGRARVPMGALELRGDLTYDVQNEAMSDESLAVDVRGRCWTVTLSRSRSPGRTDYRVSFDLGI